MNACLAKGLPMTDLYLSMLDLHGVKADRIGDSTGRLKLARVIAQIMRTSG